MKIYSNLKKKYSDLYSNVDVKIYRAISGKTITPMFYQYMGHYVMGRVLGDIFTALVILASFIVGKITGNIVIDTICYAASIGGFIYNYRNLNLLDRGKDLGYFREGNAFEFFKIMRDRLVTMIMFSRFVELYTIFLVSIIMPTMLLKVLVSLIVIILICEFKIKNNFIENKTSSIIKRNSIGQIIVLIVGLLISNIETTTIYDNLIVLAIAFILGIGRYALSKKIRRYFSEESENFETKKVRMDVSTIKEIFNLQFFSNKELMAFKKKREEEEYRRKKAEEEAKKTPEQRKKEEDERWERKRASDKAYDDYIRNWTKDIEERNAEEKRKKQEEKAYKEMERKISQGESLSDTEKQIVEKTVKESKLTANIDRTKSRR